MATDTATSEAPKTREINVEPHWPSMFDLAKEIATSQITEDNGQEFVLEMLAFCKRMCESQEKMPQSSDELLEALRNLGALDVFIYDYDTQDYASYSDDHPVTAARAAIAKATG